jgi:hypothetical protein
MSARRNPYVGPRALRAGEPLHGRDREVARLYDRVLAERIVLLYSPSGAGKSSLLQAGLIPRLQASGFAIRPVVRVGLEPPTGAPAGVNRYVLSTLLSLEEDVPQARQLELTALAGLTLAQYLARRREGEGEDAEVLVLDQFEELLTVEPTAIAARQAFFAQLGEALRDDRVWLVVAMREDFIAGLDPHRAAIPGKLRATFRLDLLDRTAALAAVQAPALASGVTFRAEAAEQLVDDLRQVRVQGIDGAVETLQGPYVEPVQLQVVCRGLWAALPADAREIAAADVARLGDVDQALARYYDAEVAGRPRASKTPERALRGWIGRHLVTANGLRTQVLRTPGTTLGLADPALAELVDAHLLRTDTRRGMTWLELAHDRIVAPLLASNAGWTAVNLTPVQRQAELWRARERPDSLLLASADEAAEQLDRASDWTPTEQAFLAESVKVRRRDEAAARNLRLLRLLAAALAAIVVVALAYALVSARARAERAVAEQRAAEAALIRQLVAQVALRRDQQPELAALLAVAAARRLTDELQRKSALLSASVTQPQLATRLIPGGAAYTRIAGQAGELLALDRRGEVVRLGLTDRSATPVLPAGIHAEDFAAHPNRPIVAISRGPAIELWDVGAAAASATIELPNDPPALGAAPPPDQPAWIEGLRFSADGSRLAAVRVRGNTARGFVIDVAARAATALKGTLPIAGSRLELSPDGEVALVGMFDPDGKIKVYARSPAATATPTPSHAGLGRTYLVRHDPYRPRLLSGGEGRVATLWTTQDGVPAPATPPRDPIADGSTDATTTPATGAATATDPTPLHLLDDGDLIDAMFLSDGALVVLTETWISVWRGEPLAPWGTPIPTPTRRMTALAPVGEGGAWIAASSGDGPILVFDPQRLATLRLREPAAPTTTGGDAKFHAMAPLVALDPAARRLLVTDFDGERARVAIHATTGGPAISGVQVGDQQFAAVSLGAERALLLDVAGTLRAWRPGDAAAAALWQLPTRPRRVALIDPAGLADHAVLAAVDANTVTIAREADGFATTTIDAREKVSAIALDRTGERLAVATCAVPRSQATCARSELRVHARGGPAAPPELLDSAVRSLVFAPDGTRLASVQTDEPPAVWDLASGRRIALTVRRAPGQFIAADFSADGQLLLASAESAHAAVLLTLWDLRTGEELAPPLTAHNLAVGAFAEDQPRTVLLAGDGGLVVSSSFDGVLLWDTSNAALARRACALAGRTLTDDEWAWFLGPGTPREDLCPRP